MSASIALLYDTSTADGSSAIAEYLPWLIKPSHMECICHVSCQVWASGKAREEKHATGLMAAVGKLSIWFVKRKNRHVQKKKNNWLHFPAQFS